VREMKRYLIFLMGGGIGFLLTILTTTMLTEVFSLWYALSYAFGLAVGTIFKFLYHRRITFNKPSKWKTRFLKFIMLVAIMTIVNWLLVYASSETLARIFQGEVKTLHYLASIFFVSGLLSLVNFWFNKHWVFRS